MPENGKKIPDIAKEMDFICIHSYPLWYGLTIDAALEANKRDYEEIKALYPDKQIMFSEAGWTTSTLPDRGMVNDQPNEDNQVKYYEQFWKWTDEEGIIAYVFEAFDEPWKGGNNPEESEKHWGIFIWLLILCTLVPELVAGFSRRKRRRRCNKNRRIDLG